MTPQEVLSRVNTEGWDEKWAEHIIERMRGTDSSMVDGSDPYSEQGRFDEDRLISLRSFTHTSA